MIIFLSLILNISYADCTKSIIVDKYAEKAFNSLLNFEKKKYAPIRKEIVIECSLYDSIKEGDILKPKNDDIDLNLRDGLFSSPVELIRYKVIKKL